MEISRLVNKHQNEISERRICASAAAPRTCSIEHVLRKTGRFQKWLQAKRLTPDLVQVSMLVIGLETRRQDVGKYPFPSYTSVWGKRSCGVSKVGQNDVMNRVVCDRKVLNNIYLRGHFSLSYSILSDVTLSNYLGNTF